MEPVEEVIILRQGIRIQLPAEARFLFVPKFPE
jgi:hypothetical protein